MNINLPLFEVGDKIDAIIAEKGNFLGVHKYVISKVNDEAIITTCKKEVKKKYIIVIHKKYGIHVANPYYKF